MAPPACPASAPPCSEPEATLSNHIPHTLRNAPGVKHPNTAHLGMSPNGTIRWHCRLAKSRAPSVAACGLRSSLGRGTALLSLLTVTPLPPSQGLVHAGPSTAPFRSTYRHKTLMHEHEHSHTCPRLHMAVVPAPPPEQWGWGAPDTICPAQPSFWSPVSACNSSFLWASLSPH